ncbi:hypothetical protein [Actinomadura sp. HBU206391]|uniref:hypothetical protein n=1 Tax=Actinomadura sp. HBU206391 TaxID=2731692 RepID=UPI00164FD671|nr:hypothetical protein [Actinomadura sp. HBU206391]MBC6456382.1 hypothetical protein [Actinomadura sp. HBU206391]
MGLADLETVDLVSSDPEGGEELHVIAGAGWPVEDEALYHVQLLIKIAGVLGYAESRRAEGKRSTVTVWGPDEPPAGVLEYLRSKGVRVLTGDPGSRQQASGRVPRIPNLPDGQPDINALQAANAANFARRHGLDGSVESLPRLDEILEARRAEHGLGPDDVDEDFTDGDLIVLGGAYAGEVMRAAVGGTWALGPHGPLGPVHLRVGTMSANVLGKVHKYLQHGAAESVSGMVTFGISELNGH